jgi:hypothetical protein
MHTLISYAAVELSSKKVYDMTRTYTASVLPPSARVLPLFRRASRPFGRRHLTMSYASWNAKEVTRSARRFALKLSDPRLADPSDARRSTIR